MTQGCIKKMKKISQIVNSVWFEADLSLVSGSHQRCGPGLFDFSLSFLPFGNSGGLQIQRCQGFAVDDYGGTLGALTLKPSGFCNIGVKR
jgi:hypothetical protein